MSRQIVSVHTTSVTRHPHWNDVSDYIERRFELVPELKKWAIDAVSAHLMGVPERSARAFRVLGERASADVRSVCRHYGIEIPRSTQDNTRV